MTGVLYAIARFCIRRRFVVLAVWVLAAVALVAVSHRLSDNTNDSLTLPGTDSQRATDALSHSFPAQSNGSSPIVLHVKSGQLTDSKYSSAVNQAAADVAKAPHVASVVNPLTSQGASALSKDKATGYLSVTTTVSPGSLSVADAQAIIDAASKPAQAAGIEVQTGGQLGQKVSKPSAESSELIGILAAMVILTFTFGTAVAMLLPIVNAILALAVTLSIVRMVSHVATVSTVAPTLATMIGLGVGIDYALFIVTRHFRGLKSGLDLPESIARAAATSGGAVVFAGGTVTIALVSLAVANIPLVTTMGLMAAIAVVVAVLAAVTLLPATLAIVGPRINSLRVRGRHPDAHPNQGLWARWAARVAASPLIAGLAALAILIPLAVPLLSLTLGQKDVAALSKSTTARQAYDLISKNFGSGVNGPLIVAVSLGSPASGTNDSRLATLQKDVSQTSGVAAITPVQVDKAGTTAYFNAISTKGPAENATADLVNKLRGSVIPQAEKGTNMKVYVGGTTAGYVDLAANISSKLPLQILVVIALSFMLLTLAFRTVVIPVQAAVMNVLSIGASYGVLTAIFQFGWLHSLIGLDKLGADRLLRAAVHVRDPVWPVDGLRGVPGQPDRGARPCRRGQQELGRVRIGHERAGDHRRRRDHGVRVRQLRAERRPDGEAIRDRARGRGDPRRHDRPLPAGARADGHDGQGELVSAPLGRQAPPAYQHRRGRVLPSPRAARTRSGRT